MSGQSMIDSLGETQHEIPVDIGAEDMFAEVGREEPQESGIMPAGVECAARILFGSDSIGEKCGRGLAPPSYRPAAGNRCNRAPVADITSDRSHSLKN